MVRFTKAAPKLRNSALYGPFIEGAWVPAPRYALRRERLVHYFKQWTTGSVLEFGCGAGALLADLERLGYQCTGIESSESARSIATQMLVESPRTQIYGNPNRLEYECFDYLISCEVLEHIENDAEELKNWLQFLKPGGTVVIAVPAHQRRFGPLDRWAGHIRRYDKKDLCDLFESAGLSFSKLECYGFPLANLTSLVRNHKLKNAESSTLRMDRNSATAKSGIDRQNELRLFEVQSTNTGQIMMRLAFLLQALFLPFNLGDGYLAIGKKTSRAGLKSK